MTLAVRVNPSTGSFWTETCVSLRCVRPPKGISTVERPMDESNISMSPRCERTLSSRRLLAKRSARSAPAMGRAKGSPSATAPICASAKWAAPAESMNSRLRSATMRPPLNIRIRAVSVTSATSTASMFSSRQ